MIVMELMQAYFVLSIKWLVNKIESTSPMLIHMWAEKYMASNYKYTFRTYTTYHIQFHLLWIVSNTGVYDMYICITVYISHEYILPFVLYRCPFCRAI